ncbi:Putative oxidoreductase bli-4, mitochondrial [Rhizoctonia solani AG-1 IB]|uniref:Putative oxidoreductase bli-4, mitochondrial n=1 Tax=Thanatephorus cucumeris (strain AG1-IB / isolate 7/3/14) TaxID=1108050 RepID=M5C734_THACB|nr:Putative oxidoreductase bli-4, mitochondrial [Rhizoctonia solani AG-1 IB]
MQALKNTIAENTGIPGAHQLAKPEHQFTLDNVPDLTGKVAIVTGGSEGIGLASATTLLKHGAAKVFILSPSPEHAEEALRFFEKELGITVVDRVTWVPCDLADWAQTHSVASLLASQNDRLDILLNIAGRGIMTAQRNQYDIDLHMALNHFGHVILTSTLLPLLKKTAESGSTVRIVNAGSNLHESAPKETRFTDVAELNKDFGPNGQYGRTKLAAILYARYLARHLSSSHPRILANAFHPGFVITRQSTEHIHEPYPILGWGNNALYPLKKDIWDGSVSVMYIATMTERSGEYICPPAIPEPGSDLSRDESLGEQLMELTKQVLKSKASIDLEFY